MKLDNNTDVLTDFWLVFTAYTSPHALDGLNDCISIVF